MKKLYIQPETSVCDIQVHSQILAASGVTSPVYGIGYGGEDNGENDPEVKGNDLEFEW